MRAVEAQRVLKQAGVFNLELVARCKITRETFLEQDLPILMLTQVGGHHFCSAIMPSVASYATDDILVFWA